MNIDEIRKLEVLEEENVRLKLEKELLIKKLLLIH